mmetsp:Transcript_13069/g.35696  ORF Transcript_13069/g.35696 Transcript_13069/m.35696 type:complete len:257 (-) Transcript_13069:651-1421(-)
MPTSWCLWPQEVVKRTQRSSASNRSRSASCRVTLKDETWAERVAFEWLDDLDGFELFETFEFFAVIGASFSTPSPPSQSTSGALCLPGESDFGGECSWWCAGPGAFVDPAALRGAKKWRSRASGDRGGGSGGQTPLLLEDSLISSGPGALKSSSKALLSSMYGMKSSSFMSRVSLPSMSSRSNDWLCSVSLRLSSKSTTGPQISLRRFVVVATSLYELLSSSRNQASFHVASAARMEARTITIKIISSMMKTEAPT